ncbi:MAG: hypothetical protein ACP5NV_04220 [Candidatus Woesearchaeota archaeon]
MDAKKLAVMIGIAVLLPLFLGVLMDAVYPEPNYNDYCSDDRYPQKDFRAEAVNCTDIYSTPEYLACSNQGGIVRTEYNATGCSVFKECDMCSNDYNDASEEYRKNFFTIFLILGILGLIGIIVGVYLSIDYIGAGLMFGGIITLVYATTRYFGELSRIARAIAIFVELLIIIWIAYKKIEDNKTQNYKNNNDNKSLEESKIKRKK